MNKKLFSIIFFAALFVGISSTGQYIFYTYTPADYFVDISSSAYLDIPYGQEYAELIVDREVKQDYPGTVTGELFNERGVAVHSRYKEIIYQSSSNQEVIEVAIPLLPRGEYCWEEITTFNVLNHKKQINLPRSCFKVY